MECYSSHDQYTCYSLIVYAIAKKDLKPETEKKLKDYLDYMKENDVNYPSWYELACWPDDIRNTGLKLFDGWHYADTPFYDGISPSESTFQPHPKYNTTYVLIEAIKIFQTKGNMFFKSLMLRFFIHLVGDMHQPLHMTTRITKERKGGDKGGNDFKLQGSINNLHTLWDRAMDKINAVKRVSLT